MSRIAATLFAVGVACEEEDLQAVGLRAEDVEDAVLADGVGVHQDVVEDEDLQLVGREWVRHGEVAEGSDGRGDDSGDHLSRRAAVSWRGVGSLPRNSAGRLGCSSYSATPMGLGLVLSANSTSRPSFSRTK